MDVYVVEAVGVYNQGVYFIGESLEAAELFCKSCSPDNDGYHRWMITKHTMNTNVGTVYPAHPKTQIEIP